MITDKTSWVGFMFCIDKLLYDMGLPSLTSLYIMQQKLLDS